MSKTAVIIVTHNSGRVIGQCLDAIAAQTAVPEQVVVVDSGSHDTGYLDKVERNEIVSVVDRRDNIGFARANNLGMTHVRQDIDYVAFLNPDTLLQGESLRLAAQDMENDPAAGIVTGMLLSYDFDAAEPTGLIDSTGIFRKWYGRWYDRGKGEVEQGKYQENEHIPAACGAFLFCRREALNHAAVSGSVIFDEDFFLYKEDIELCLRVRKAGWTIRYLPEISVFHGRGWQGERKRMSRELRKTAARSEILLYTKHPSPYMAWALLKYFFVVICDG
jgi:GT2 family glycosyltransferase